MSLIDDVKRIHQLFLRNGWSLAVAESCTGGMISHLITEVPGASKFFLGGLVAYDLRIKTAVLGVPEDIVQKRGVISEECAVAMAQAIRRLFGATYGLSTTGNLGPEAQEGKPVGEIFIGLAGPEQTDYIRLQLRADRSENKAMAAKKAIEFLLLKVG